MPLRLVNWYAALLYFRLWPEIFIRRCLLCFIPTKVQAWNTIDPHDKELEKNVEYMRNENNCNSVKLFPHPHSLNFHWIECILYLEFGASKIC